MLMNLITQNITEDTPTKETKGQITITEDTPTNETKGQITTWEKRPATDTRQKEHCQGSKKDTKTQLENRQETGRVNLQKNQEEMLRDTITRETQSKAGNSTLLPR